VYILYSVRARPDIIALKLMCDLTRIAAQGCHKIGVQSVKLSVLRIMMPKHGAVVTTAIGKVPITTAPAAIDGMASSGINVK
jgi:hypothetical protein